MDLNAFLSQASKFLSPDALLVSTDEAERYGSDWTKTVARPGPVCLPRSTDEVAQILKLCEATRVPVVPSGGRTGLAGGAVATHGEVVLSLERMRRIDPVDTLGKTVRVQAGTTTQAVHEHAAAFGLTWPIDLASKGSSTVGGNLSTNAGGVKVVRYGMSRKWVIGIQAVLMGGEVIELNRGLEKNNTGYDLVQLLIGSEGTLAVITEATLKLVRIPSDVYVMLFPLPTIDAVMTLFEESRNGPMELLAFEFFSRKCLKAVQERLGCHCRLSSDAAFYALLEVEGRDGIQSKDRIEQWLSTLLGKAVVDDGELAASSEQQRELWELREGITESLQLTAPLKKYDVSVPVTRVAPFLKAVERLIQEKHYELELYLFGHAGDGSPHLNLLKPEGVELQDFAKDCQSFEQDLYALLKSEGGSVSAEHGVGLIKKSWLPYSRSQAEMRIFHGIKRTFDPHELLNPGKVIDL